MQAFPIRQMKTIYHVGTLNKEDKKNGSHEGAGLSFSTHPNEWRRITPLLGDLFQGKKEQPGQFIDIHKLTEKQKILIYEWGVFHHYIIRTALFRVEYFDDEMDSDVYSDYETKEAASREADEDMEILEIEGYIATDKLRTKTMNKCDPVLVFDLLCTVFAEIELQIDGVWWDDLLDVYRYSAPRGVIVSKKLSEWTFINLEKTFLD